MSAAAARPAWLTVDPAGIPHGLTDATAWYPALIKPKTGKVGKWDKIPADPDTGQPATWSDPATRCTFDTAFMAYQRDPRFKGIGYMMHAGAGVIGIDLDDCFNPDGTVKPWAQQIVDDFDGAYWERSISGTGLRGFCLGSLPVGGCRSKIEGSSVELYADERFLVVTGQAIRPVDELPVLQDAVDALHDRLTAGRVRATGTAVSTGLVGPTANPSPEAFAIIEALMGGPCAAQMSEIWGRDDLHAVGVNEQDWALEKETVRAAMARGYTGDALARISEEVVRAGPYRQKWDERRRGVTWLAQDIANAIETVEQERKQPEAVAEEEAAAAPIETPAQIIARLGRELAQERTRSAAQQTIIRAHNRVEGELRAEIERLNREKYAEWRLRRSKLKSAQVDTFMALTRIGTKRADWLDKDAPVITGKNIGDELGVHESTARANAEAVCNLPGSPIKRVTAYRKDGKRGQLTTYELPVRDPIELIERMVVIAEALDAPKPNRPRPIQCPKHPKAKVLIYAQHECSRCGDILQSDFQDARPLCEEVTRIETTLPPVDVPVLYPVHVARIGEPTPDRLAASPAVNGTNGHAPPVATRPRAPSPIDFWRCACTAYERRPHPLGGWRCAGCNMDVPSPEERP